MGESREVRICILQRGWVLVGYYRREMDMMRGISSGYIIRRWGTEKGLGQIAINGPTEDTILDPAPIADWHALTEVFTMPCSAGKWASVLGESPSLINES